MSALKKRLQSHTTFYASFDRSADADFSRGNPAAALNRKVVRHEKDGGRFGGALVFSARDHGWAEDECTYAAEKNFPYRPEGGPFEGTISFWLFGDPDRDLAPEYPVDPFHISRHPSDGSFYLDLTKPNDWRYGSPRKLRFGLYRDSPEQNMFVGGQLLVVGELHWGDGRWHHLAATFRNINSGGSDAEAAVYIDGRRRATMSGFEHQVHWNIEERRIGLGQRYVGKLDDFLLLDAALQPEEVAALYELNAPAGSLL